MKLPYLVALDEGTPNLPTNIVDFGGFDSSIMLILRGGIPGPKGDFPESLSQAMSVGRLGPGVVRLGSRSPAHSRCVEWVSFLRNAVRPFSYLGFMYLRLQSLDSEQSKTNRVLRPLGTTYQIKIRPASRLRVTEY